jgi:Zn-finger nucleic acid-binding protein
MTPAPKKPRSLVPKGPFPKDEARFRDRACPRDHAPLRAEKMKVPGPDVTVDRCPTCDGVFLDKNELLRLTGDRQLNQYLRDEVALDSDSQLLCPHCGGIMDMERVAGVEVEVCLDCFGLWLDKGELEALAARRNAEKVPMSPEKEQDLARAAKVQEGERRRNRGVLAQYDRALTEFVRRYL